jgi:outer membrane protein TolC
LAQEQQQYQLTLNLDQQVHFAQLASSQIRSRYVNGAMEFLRVLSALLSQQSLERSRLLAQQQLIDYRINLYRALAGGRIR